MIAQQQKNMQQYNDAKVHEGTGLNPRKLLAPGIKICPLGGVWENQELPLFILGPPSYLQN